MRNISKYSLLLCIVLFCNVESTPQNIEVKDGVKFIQNEKVGLWGANARLSLVLHKTHGGLEIDDENLAFRAPYDMCLDSSGNMYILDSGNNRIQKLDADGKFLKSIGQRGQGPAEFQFPLSIDVDDEDNFYIFDTQNMRIQVFSESGQLVRTIKFKKYAQNQIRVLDSGRIVMGGNIHLRTWMELKKKLPTLIQIVDQSGKNIVEFGEVKDFDDLNVNSRANKFDLDTDVECNIYLSFMYQNRIEKYSEEGQLLWKATRVLNYGTDVIDKGFIQRDEKGTTIQAPTLNMVSTGISADDQGRIWILTLDRQMSREEMGYMTSGGETDYGVDKLDAYKIEIFNLEGVLLGEIPLNHHAHGIRVFGDTLFIWERNTTSFYQYKIVENKLPGLPQPNSRVARNALYYSME